MKAEATIRRYALRVIDGIWEIHREGCTHLKRGLAQTFPARGVNPKAVIQSELADNNNELRDMGYDEGYYVVFPCARRATRS